MSKPRLFPLIQRFVAAFALLGLVAGCATTTPTETMLAVPAPAQKYAAVVIDGGSGRTLFEANSTAPRYPASLTKMMTLYLLFEALEQGRVSKTTLIPVSANAARQPPTKLRFRRGETIDVDSAIRAITVKSANDVAVAVAEYLGGGEQAFAAMMTAKARQIGMRSTVFRNASGLPDAGQQTTMGRAGAARITVTRDGEVLWRLIAVRPAASSGRDGSGVELRSVSYRGKKVLRRAHVPILNVRYDGDACGPFRDWQNEESRFQADGAAVAPGFRLCDQPATTILETDRDRGNFAGVAVFVDGQQVELVSELEAGWYRYVSRWRLHADGTIRARFGFGAVRNSCVCDVHHHHAYWRLDFDIAGAGDDTVLEHNDPPLPGHADNWHTLRHEVRRKRNPGRERRWRVKNRGSGEGYTIVPGADDGEADGYGVGDFWALRRRAGQIDDYPIGDTRAQIDRFVNRESIVGTDVVVWYAGHFSHDVAHDHSGGDAHIVGPTLRPDRW
jgi:hypothetical protein